ncbi:MAG: hypothetical protein FJW96_02995 [Actinobacteria bacterium]|nr:hypothetical protein [Actinomycetota bacterium]
MAKRKRIPPRTPEEVEKDREARDLLEYHVSKIERETGNPRDRWTLAERIAMIDQELAERRKIA